MKVDQSCYVISTWGGNRRLLQHPSLAEDGALYVREHLRRISCCKRISRIVVVSPRGESFHRGYEEYLTKLEGLKELNGIPIEVFRRENIGLSYGSFNDVYGKYRTKFDYYFFAEDDYLPAVPDIDEVLISMIEGLPICGFLCGMAWSNGGPFHAGIFLGILRAEALEKVWVANGCLAHLSRRGDYEEAQISGQIGISRNIVAAGYEVVDWTKSHSSPFWYGAGSSPVKVFGDPKQPPLYVPAQSVDMFGRGGKIYS